jgi:Ni,Fe-hydrogenase III large subunit
VRDNVTYTVGTVAKNDAKDYSNVNEAARASGMPG